MVAASSSYAYAVGTSCELSLTTCTSRRAQQLRVMPLRISESCTTGDVSEFQTA